MKNELNDFSLEQYAKDFYEDGLEPNETSRIDWEKEHSQFLHRAGSPYSQYKGSKSTGCILHYIYLFCNLTYAERCCPQNGGVTLSPYTDGLIASSYEWIEDSPGVFRPHFEFVKDFDWSARDQEIYEKYL